MITASTIIKTGFGNFKVSYHKFGKKICVSFSYGDLAKNEPIVRFHSACLFGEAFHSLHCDCQHQITKVMSLIQTNGNGVIIYAYQEGRGIGLENKIKSMELERIPRDREIAELQQDIFASRLSGDEIGVENALAMYVKLTE